MGGMAVAAIERDERLIQDVLGKLEFPPGVGRNVRIEFGEDHTDAPAVWIWFPVARGQFRREEEPARFVRFSHVVEEALLDAGLERFPYIHVRGEDRPEGGVQSAR